MCGSLITPSTLEQSKAIRVGEGCPVRTYEKDGKRFWSKVDENMKDLTVENSEGMIFHVRSYYVPHGSKNPLADFMEKPSE